MATISALSDKELLVSLASLNSNEVKVIGNVLLHLIEVGKRKLYASCGYPSLFTYCVEVLKYCDGTAGRRVAAARCIEKFPKLLKLFLERQLTLNTIALISKILTPENEEKIIALVSNKRQAEVESLVATYLPEKSIREGVKALPSLSLKTSSIENGIQPSSLIKEADSISKEENQHLKPVEANNEINCVQSFEVKLKARDSAVHKLHRVQELRGKHESLGELFELLLDEYLEKHSPEAREQRREQRKKQELKEQTHSNEGERSRYIPQRVRDKLYHEYSGQCAYTAPDGTRCTCRKSLQVDHIYPFGAGGTNNMENLRLLCPTHNRFMAESFYGRDYMKNNTAQGGT